jgi:hypothetical protein
MYSALEKKKRPDPNGIENNPEITKHNETNAANGNNKRAPTYSGEHGISHANLYVIKKKLSGLSFIVIKINNEVGYA